MRWPIWMITLISCSLAVSNTQLTAQSRGGLGGGFSPSGSLGASGGRGGRAGGSLRGPAVNPNFNPPGSLSPTQRFSPRGSINPALNLNPEGSLFRPETGSSSARTTTNRPGSINSRYEATRGARTTRYEDFERRTYGPTAAQLDLMPRRSLRRWVSVSSAQLDTELDQFGNGESWKKALRLSELAQLLPSDGELNPGEDGQQRLRDIAQRFEKVAGKEEYRRVWQLPGFQSLQPTLQELSVSDSDGGLERLMNSTLAMNRALGEISKDTDWQEFLALPLKSSRAEANAADPAAEPDLDELKTTLARFEQVDTDPKYAKIAALPEFQATRENLAAYIQHRAQ